MAAKKPSEPPVYSINDIVYLKGSAAIGFLESYKITGLRFDVQLDAWIYEIGLSFNITGAPITIGDNITLKGRTNEHNILHFTEDELIEFCEAAQMVETVLEQRLSRIREQRTRQCGGT
jgi:hypothetical protein